MTDPKDLADTELSGAVAVEVMKWVAWPYPAPKPPWPTAKPERFSPDAVHWYNDPPPYATDIAAAIEVFEKVCGEAEDRYSMLVRDSNDPPSWECAFTGNSGDFVEAATAPRAICEAALLWARSRDA